MGVHLQVLIYSLLTHCTPTPSSIFANAGFDERSILSAQLKHTGGDTAARPLSPSELAAVLKELHRINPAKTAVVEPRFAITLLTGSSLESQKMDILIDNSGEGYFRHGRKGEVMFYTSSLPKLLDRMK